MIQYKEKDGIVLIRLAQVSSIILVGITKMSIEDVQKDNNYLTNENIIKITIDLSPLAGNPRKKNKIHIFKQLICVMRILKNEGIEKAMNIYPEYGFKNHKTVRFMVLYFNLHHQDFLDADLGISRSENF